ncbi:MAG: hypothetical protein ACRER2_12155 [Methylococcales bacterium]
MYNKGFKTLLVAVAFVPVGNVLAFGTPRPAVRPPVIVSTEMNVQDNGMVISGHHFGTAASIVRLGDQVLSIKSHSENQTVIDLPPEIRPATYRLTLTTDGPRKLTSDPFNATITSLANR